MLFNKITIRGLRGFNTEQSLSIAIPNGESGSGLTCIVGPNNSGKSTIYESFRAISQQTPPSFTEGRRNKHAGDRIQIKLYNEENHFLELSTINSGGSETDFKENDLTAKEVKIFTLPSRRTFSPFFGRNILDRENFINNSTISAVRGTQMDNFSYRLFQIQKEPSMFNNLLKTVLDEIPNWCIEQSDSGQFYLKFNYNEMSHNSDGTGEGLLSIFTIIDSLYDSKKNDIIVIDEPELSLHPSLQKKLMNLLLDFSKSRQIVILTHSPYFISWEALFNGGQIARTWKRKYGIEIYQIQSETIKGIKSFENNFKNPHILGLNAREVFFLQDKILLTEGQEDVIYYGKIIDILNLKINGNFYGWGVGGANNMDKIIFLLKDLGFQKISVILDKNKEELIPKLSTTFIHYQFNCIPTDDVVDKDKVINGKTIIGLIDSKGETIKPEYLDSINLLFAEINSYFELP